MSICGLVLAGGRSTRMGGSDKAMTILAGQTLLDRAVARLSSQVDDVVVSSNMLGPDAVNAPVIADATATFDGPLAGIQAGLQWAQPRGHASLASVAVDTPFFPPDLVQRLCAGDSARIQVARSGGRVHPVFALWPIAALDPLTAFLTRAETRKVMAFLDEFGFDAIDFASEPFDPFFNVNTPDDLAEAERLIEP
ncbi:MAG: molybdenum cofactor guanylyltransferase MobA [Rhizobiaceae bacterium]|nr:molybdenum cofactor guanylyltransferase MobA [Rhizobiaceae bacterium]